MRTKNHASSTRHSAINLQLEQRAFAQRPNYLVKPTPTSSACWSSPCFALRCGLPRALGFSEKFMATTRSPILILCAISFLYGAWLHSQKFFWLIAYSDTPNDLSPIRISVIFLTLASTALSLACAYGLIFEEKWAKSLSSKLYLFTAIYCLLLPVFINIYVSLIKNISFTDISLDWDMQLIGFAIIILALRTLLLKLGPTPK